MDSKSIIADQYRASLDGRAREMLRASKEPPHITGEQFMRRQIALAELRQDVFAWVLEHGEEFPALCDIICEDLQTELAEEQRCLDA